jgi:hypothetical protein
MILYAFHPKSEDKSLEPKSTGTRPVQRIASSRIASRPIVSRAEGGNWKSKAQLNPTSLDNLQSFSNHLASDGTEWIWGRAEFECQKFPFSSEVGRSPKRLE